MYLPPIILLSIYPNLSIYKESFVVPSLPSLPTGIIIYHNLSIYLSIYIESPFEPSLPSLPAGQPEARRIKQPGKDLLFQMETHNY